MRRLLAGIACLATAALCQTAQAAIEISLDPTTHTPSDVPFNDIGGNSTSLFGWLQGEILSYNNFVAGNNPLPDPTTGLVRYDDLNGSGTTLNVLAGDYIVSHYGVGDGGVPGTGGGLVAYYVDADGTFVVPDNGPGPNGLGGISFVAVWDHTGTPGESVPDGGTTWAMLAAGVAAMGIVGRKQKTARA